MTIRLHMPSTDGGEEEGINDSGVETFLDNPHKHIARESAQNSIDATHDRSRPAELDFQLLSVPRGQLPEIDGRSRHGRRE